MRSFCKLIILLFSFFILSTLAKAEFVNEVEVEGYRLGDSLLNYFTKNEINKIFKKKENRLSNTFYVLEISKNSENKNFEQYDGLGIVFKREEDFPIHGLLAQADLDVNNEECAEIQKEIVSALREAFPKSKKTRKYANKLVKKKIVNKVYEIKFWGGYTFIFDDISRGCTIHFLMMSDNLGRVFF
jgi:hypothetical protein